MHLSDQELLMVADIAAEMEVVRSHHRYIENFIQLVTVLPTQAFKSNHA